MPEGVSMLVCHIRDDCMLVSGCVKELVSTCMPLCICVSHASRTILLSSPSKQRAALTLLAAFPIPTTCQSIEQHPLSPHALHPLALIHAPVISHNLSVQSDAGGPR